MIKLQSDFLGPFFVEDGSIVRPMALSALKLSGELDSARVNGANTYRVTDANDDEETWPATMGEIVYNEARRFLKPADFERFVCLACGEAVCKYNSIAYPKVAQLFPDGFDPAMQHVQAHERMVKVIERSYYRRLAQNHFTKARSIRDGETELYGMSTDVMTRKG